ncbi:MAG TPA: PQQ-dependent sugar dehydrogenase, partial [Thermoanaerobaculia bacterium]
MKRRATTLAAAFLIASLGATMEGAATLPTGFQDVTVFTGLTHPTAVRFARDGRVFVAEKSGVIKVFPTLLSTTPTIFADLSSEVDDYWDRGLLGLELHPDFPTTPYVYVLYSYDFDPVSGTGPPAWGDNCPSPPGATTNGCTISARLSRLTANGNQMTGTEKVLLESWGQQFPSHSIGDLLFGPDGALYVSGGEGASFNNVDYGQYGSPRNPLGDPPSGKGGTQAPPTAEGGALRSQSLLRAEGGPALPSGAVIRLDSSDVLSNDPLAGSGVEIAQRIVAYGLRNPFRFTIQPDTGSVWIGDVGWTKWEEINRIADPQSGHQNFGWPCYEGGDPEPAYAGANLAICNNLYAEPGSTVSPYFSYSHSNKVIPGEACPTGSSSVTGLAFYGGGGYPASYGGALFFGDYSRRCIWVMFADATGQPDPSQILNFVTGAATPVDLEIEPNSGDLFYVDLGGGTVRRVQYFAPTAVATASPTSGGTPLTVHFDGSGSLKARPTDTLSYAWDLDGDGNFNDSTAVKPTFTYTTAGSYRVRLRVTDNHGISNVSDPVTISAGNSLPTAFIDTPSPSLTWRVGDTISFSGHATDPQEGDLPASALTWNVLLHHCPSTCHVHPIQTIPGVASGSFAAPDHEYPSWLELQLTATDSAQLTSSQSALIYPQTTTLTYQSSPTGLVLVSGTRISATPFTDTVIVGSQKTIVAASPQTSGGIPYG